MIDVVRVVGNLADLFDAVQGIPQEGLTVNPTANPNEFSYSLDLPLSGNGPDDTRIAGLIGFDADPTDGIEIDDTANLTGTITSLGGPLTGSFDLDLVFTEAGVSITGTMTLNNSDGCDLDITISGADPLLFAFNDIPQVAVNILGLEFSGTLFVSFSVLGQSFETTIVLAPGLQDAAVSGNQNGEPFEGFDIEVFPDPAAIESLLFCFYFGGEGVFTILDDLGDVYGAILDPGSFPNVNVQPGVPSGAYVDYDFTADFGGYTVEGTIRLPTDPNGTGIIAFDFTSATPVLTGSVAEFSGSGTFYINFTAGEPVSAYGTATLMTTDGCMVDAEIHQSDPVLLIEDLFDSGVATFVAKALGNTLTIVIDFSELLVQDSVLDANINGISIPGELILGVD